MTNLTHACCSHHIDEEWNELLRELAVEAENYSRSHEDGWFYPDQD